MSKFKKGDKVRIREDLVTAWAIEKLDVVDDMLQYAGKEATVTFVGDYGDYHVNIDNGYWHWTDEMFEDEVVDIGLDLEAKMMRETIEEAKEESKLYFAKLREDAIIPTKNSEDAGYDIYANFPEDYMIIEPHETVMIPTGICSAFSEDYYIQLVERGSTGTKGIAQRCGCIDSGYRNEWFVPITNTRNNIIVITKLNDEETRNRISDEVIRLMKHDNIICYPYTKGISQAVVLPVPKMNVQEISAEELQSIPSKRGSGMLGSSGK